MIVNDLDMNYLGVYDVWNNDLGEIYVTCSLCFLSLSILIDRFANLPR